MNSLHSHTHEDIRNMFLKPHLIWTSFEPTWDKSMCHETNAYVLVQGLQNDNLIYPPIPYVLMSAKVVFFWEMVLSMSRSSHSYSKHTYTHNHMHTHSNHTCLASKCRKTHLPTMSKSSCKKTHSTTHNKCSKVCTLF